MDFDEVIGRLIDDIDARKTAAKREAVRKEIADFCAKRQERLRGIADALEVPVRSLPLPRRVSSEVCEIGKMTRFEVCVTTTSGFARPISGFQVAQIAVAYTPFRYLLHDWNTRVELVPESPSSFNPRTFSVKLTVTFDALPDSPESQD